MNKGMKKSEFLERCRAALEDEAFRQRRARPEGGKP